MTNQAPTIKAEIVYKNIVGSKFELTSGLDITQIAKLVRAEIKAAIKSGRLPSGLKCSVKTSKFAGGQSLDVRMLAPAGMPIRVSSSKEEDNRARGARYPWMPRRAHASQRVVKSIVDAYNFDKGHSQSDCFHVRFYGSVEFVRDLY